MAADWLWVPVLRGREVDGDTEQARREIRKTRKAKIVDSIEVADERQQ